jgi:tetratricopeptide (TPR) repeat protein
MPFYIYRAVLVLLSCLLIVSCTTIKGADELIEGKESYLKSNYHDAIDILTVGIEKNPGYWVFYLYRGLAYEKNNQYDLAKRDLSTAIELGPKAEKWYSKMPEKDCAKIYLKRGNIYHKEKSYELAIADYYKALSLDPKLTNAYYCRAEARDQLNKLSAAVEDYSKVVELMSGILSGIPDSDKWNVHFKRGSIYARLEDFDQAIDDFDRCIKINPGNENAYLYRASARLISSCDLSKILEDYYSVINIDSVDDDTRQSVYNQMAWILATADDEGIRNSDRAIAYAKKSVEIKSNCRNLDTLAVAFAGKGMFEEALNINKKAIKACKIEDPELVGAVEKHFYNFEKKKAIREKCPGVDVEWEQLEKWQKGLLNN